MGRRYHGNPGRFAGVSETEPASGIRFDSAVARSSPPSSRRSSSCVAVAVGWHLTRDRGPGRAANRFSGDESRYWRLDLRADDAGLKKLFERFEADRRRVAAAVAAWHLSREHPAACTAGRRLEDIAPFTLEGSWFTSDPASGPSGPDRLGGTRDVLARRASYARRTEVDAVDASAATPANSATRSTSTASRSPKFSTRTPGSRSTSVGNRVLDDQ